MSYYYYCLSYVHIVGIEAVQTKKWPAINSKWREIGDIKKWRETLLYHLFYTRWSSAPQSLIISHHRGYKVVKFVLPLFLIQNIIQLMYGILLMCRVNALFGKQIIWFGRNIVPFRILYECICRCTINNHKLNLLPCPFKRGLRCS